MKKSKFSLRKKSRKLNAYGCLIFLTLLSACSNQPTTADIPVGASFTANILADGTKLFVYSERRMNREREELEEERELTGQRSDRPRPKVSGARIAQNVQRNVGAMLAQNHYCRDGYLVLEQYEERTGYVVRGECRDTANESDRRLFPRGVNSQ